MLTALQGTVCKEGKKQEKVIPIALESKNMNVEFNHKITKIKKILIS